MLGDARAGRRRHEHRSGRDVEGVGAVAARADDVDKVIGHLSGYINLGGEFAHDGGSGRDFADGLFFDAQPHDEGGCHDGRHLAAHDQPHQVQHFVVEDLAVLDAARQRFLRSDGHGRSVFSWAPPEPQPG
jgi:hypothetical protein